MNNRLATIYTYLVDNRKHELTAWHNEYREFTTDVQRIRTALESGKKLRDSSTYADTIFGKEESPFDAFIKKLLYDQSNGISSRGQSVLSENYLQKFKDSVSFDEVIEDLILDPNSETYQKLKDFWSSTKESKNPVLVNRAIAACTLTVTSTVDEGKFNQVYRWLEDQELVEPYPQNAPFDWFSRSQFVMEHLKSSLSNVAKVDDYWISLFYWEMYTNLSNPFSLKKQIVKYGAPGTGKTYKAKETCKLQFRIWKNNYPELTDITIDDVIETVQFHPSYSYEDFIEGLRPNLEGKLTLENGIFKNICIEAGKWEVDMAKIDVEFEFHKATVSDIIPYREKLSGDYWEFIFSENPNKKLIDVVPPYFIVIDEINRAEISRVFGELMYCLEYRGVAGKLKTQYAQLNSEHSGMIKLGNGYQFFVPNNLYIIATMNTIDRSVESFDFALRRRFRWEEVIPDTQLLKYHLEEYNKKWVDLSKSLKALNDAIENEPLLGKDYCIGHAYFWELPYAEDLSLSEVKKTIWNDSLCSLLEEYLRGTGRNDIMSTLSSSFGIR
ncbi:McrB family protein [Gelidibacter pelagius]|uniref:AAA family ATPase n=1 Tax=Gelidibacter pelagius TaxID=2819985 RepID=A0ABS3SN03_9FLAO|nr:AAA family ATPase [Gelidibacter pelagius]MBO3096826.1 AAA family ATPase [Gelidibacter pelagius]